MSGKEKESVRLSLWSDGSSAEQNSYINKDDGREGEFYEPKQIDSMGEGDGHPRLGGTHDDGMPTDDAPLVAELALDEGAMAARVAAQVTERLQNDLEGELRSRVERRLLEERKRQIVATDVKIVPDKDEGEDSNRRCKRIAFAIFCALLLAAGVAIAVVFTSKRSPQPTKAPTNAPTPVQFSVRMLEFFQVLHPFLLDRSDEISAGDGIKMLSDAQFMALEWLADIDEAQLSSDVDDETTISVILERYVLAVVYFTTEGESSWERQLGFLGMDDVCSWNVTTSEDPLGVFCIYGTSSVGALNMPRISMVGMIPTELALLSNLYRLNMIGNDLYGKIPSEIYTLTKLTLLWLRENSFTGSLLTEIGQLTQLRSFDASLNELDGPIPTELGNLHSTLEGFFAFENSNFNGPLPSEIGLLTKLDFFDVNKCQLTGTIPTELERLDNLKRLYLQENIFNGTIPPGIGSLTMLELLCLSDNDFTGLVPTALQSLTLLHTLHLHNTLLTGDLDPLFCDLESDNGTSPFYIDNFLADCDGSPPRTPCSCCTGCCDELQVCRNV